MQIKYGRFKLSRTQPNSRECNSCGHSQLGDPRVPRMVCGQCQSEYCFFHSNAHVGSTCKRWEAQQRRQNKQSEAAISKMAKQCPKCRAPVLKSAGCNHMVCWTVVLVPFCWLSNNDRHVGKIRHARNAQQTFAGFVAVTSQTTCANTIWSVDTHRACVYVCTFVFLHVFLSLTV